VERVFPSERRLSGSKRNTEENKNRLSDLNKKRSPRLKKQNEKKNCRWRRERKKSQRVLLQFPQAQSELQEDERSWLLCQPSDSRTLPSLQVIRPRTPQLEAFQCLHG